MGNHRYGTNSSVGKRYYDPEDARQRRLGQAQATGVGAGAVASGYGGKKIYDETKGIRQRLKNPEKGAKTNKKSLDEANEQLKKVPGGRTRVSHEIKPNLTDAERRKLFSISRRNATLVGGGLLGVGAASQITRHASGNRGRGWN